jgi:transcriptional regulator with XRE-family HTH domain
MHKTLPINIFHTLNRRRKSLRLTFAALAKKSGVSMATLVRTLTGNNPQVSFAHFFAIATALGMDIQIEPIQDEEEILENQARHQAKKIVGMAQASSGLEAQAVNQETLDKLERRLVRELLTGPASRLWSD